MCKYMIDRNDTVAAAIDFQKNIVAAMRGSDELIETSSKFIEGLKVLGVPILVTQQYTKGLGETVPEIASALGEFEHIEKTTFSAFKTPEFKEALEATGKKTVIVFGIEAHVCVAQTVLELLEAGYKVFVITDCISSRKKNDMKVCEKRLAAAGAVMTTYEAALFEMMDGSKTEGFKEISRIVK